jgi:leucyl-tRNA synthetase
VWGFGAKNAEALKGSTGAAALSETGKTLRREVHQVLRQISFDYERMQYNTVVSGSMKLLNALEACRDAGAQPVLREGYGILLRALYPACPHTTWTLWNELGYATTLGDLLDATWPDVDESALVQDEIELMLQVNGKLRGAITVPASADKAVIEKAALASPELLKFADGAPVRRVIVVPGRLVNVVL